MTTLARMSSACLITERTREPAVLQRLAASWSVSATGVSAAGRVFSSVIVEHPILGEEEVDCREHADDDDQQPGHRRGITHLELTEPALVQVERVEQRGVGRTAGAVGDHEGLGERLERPDDLQ